MKIKMHFPASGIAAIKKMGLRQRNPETLKWVLDHPASHYGAGVILRGKSGEMLDGSTFRALHDAFGAWIECDSGDTKNKVSAALAAAAVGMDDQIIVGGDHD